MELQMLTIFDSKANAYLQPFFTPTVATGLRSIEEILLDKNHQFAKHPGDYSLFHVGTYDDQTGVTTPITHINLGCIVQLMPGQPVEE